MIYTTSKPFDGKFVTEIENVLRICAGERANDHIKQHEDYFALYMGKVELRVSEVEASLWLRGKKVMDKRNPTEVKWKTSAAQLVSALRPNGLCQVTVEAKHAPQKFIDIYDDVRRVKSTLTHITVMGGMIGILNFCGALAHGAKMPSLVAPEKDNYLSYYRQRFALKKGKRYFLMQTNDAMDTYVHERSKLKRGCPVMSMHGLMGTHNLIDLDDKCPKLEALRDRICLIMCDKSMELVGVEITSKLLYDYQMESMKTVANHSSVIELT